MKRSRQAPGGFFKRQRVDNPVGVLLNRLTRLPIEILNQILRMAAISRTAIPYQERWPSSERWASGGWAGTERMRIQNWFWIRFVSWNDGDYPRNYEDD